MLLYLLIILVDFFIVLVLNFEQIPFLPINNIIAISSIYICILSYLYVNFEMIWEIKSLVFNIFQLFGIHTYSKVITILEKNNKTE